MKISLLALIVNAICVLLWIPIIIINFINGYYGMLIWSIISIIYSALIVYFGYKDLKNNKVRKEE